jgi:anti-sigma B factor antagonist
MSLSMSIAHDSAGIAFLRLDGDIDLRSKRDFDRCIAATVAEAETVAVVVDLAGATFIDSVGIASLLIGRRLADAAGTEYRIAGATGRVRQVLDLTGVWEHLSGSRAESG